MFGILYSRRFSKISFFTGLNILVAFDIAGAAVKLTPQDVVEMALAKGERAKAANYLAQRSYLTLQNALGAYDFQFKITPSYEESQAPTIAGGYNLFDRTQTITSTLAKQFSTGTYAAVDYIGLQQSSTLQPTSTRTPNITLNSLQLTLRQSIWRDAFGKADRLYEEMGRGQIEAAKFTRDQTLQTIMLDAMTSFWNTYIAEKQLRENLAAREKYEILIRNVRQKAGYNLSTPGELPRLQAELEGVEQKVKNSSSTYLNSLQTLATSIRLDMKDPVELDVPVELPPIPRLEQKDLNALRPVRIAQTNLSVAEKTLNRVKSQNHPRFDVVAKAKSTGVDESNGTSLAQMQSGSKPTYYVGVEFETPLGSELQRGQETDAWVALKQAETELVIQSDNVRDQLIQLERTVVSQYSVAKSAIATVDLRGKVVREMEVAYRQGRQPLVELIRSYNDFFQSQQDRASAVGKYHIALNQLAAARDELVASVTK